MFLVEHPPKGGDFQGISPAPVPIQEIAEPLFDLKVGMEQLAKNHTFKCILATLLAMGNFLNGSQVRNGVLGDAAWVLRGLACPRPQESREVVWVLVMVFLINGKLARWRGPTEHWGFRAEALSWAIWRRCRR